MSRLLAVLICRQVALGRAVSKNWPIVLGLIASIVIDSQENNQVLDS